MPSPFTSKLQPIGFILPLVLLYHNKAIIAQLSLNSVFIAPLGKYIPHLGYIIKNCPPKAYIEVAACRFFTKVKEHSNVACL